MAFHEVRFPLRLALGVSGGPVRRTDIVSLTNGREARNQRWRDSRRFYDAGSGIRALADLYGLIDFFEARAGALHGFRFRDPLDWKSCRPDRAVGATDQLIGTGTGTERRFRLVKVYGDRQAGVIRDIAKPVAGTVLLAIDGRAVPPADITIDPLTGTITFAAGKAPATGASVTAGFEFDVPVRFGTDRLDISLDAFQAGRVPSVPLVEIAP